MQRVDAHFRWLNFEDTTGWVIALPRLLDLTEFFTDFDGHEFKLEAWFAISSDSRSLL